jgi:hypothetical protein
MSESQQVSPNEGVPEDSIAGESGLRVVDSTEAIGAGDEDAPPASTQSITVPKKTLALVLVLGAGAGYKFYYDKKAEQKAAAIAEAKRKAEQEAREKAEAAARAEKALVADFDEVVAVRTKILAAEASSNAQASSAQSAAKAYQSAVKARDKKIKRAWAEYEQEYDRVQQHNDLERSKAAYSWFYTPDYWEYPDSPTDPDPIKVPSFAKQSKTLRQIDSNLKTVAANIDVLQVDKQLNMMLKQLKDSAAVLSEEALHNADVLTTCVEPATEESPGSLDAKELATLRVGGAKALFALINDAQLRFIREHGLDIRVYDVRGGRDASKSDSSFALATPSLASAEASAAE